MAAIDVEHFRALRDLPGWHRHGNTISKTFGFDDFAAAMRSVDRAALAAVATGHQPAIDIRGDHVTVAFAPKQGDTLTLDHLAAARRVQRPIGDHRPPVGQAGPWSAPRTDRGDPPTPGAGPARP